jgi:hypothetical protein
MIRDILTGVGLLTLIVANVTVHARTFLISSLIVLMACILVPDGTYVKGDGEVMAGATRLVDSDDDDGSLVAKANPYRKSSTVDEAGKPASTEPAARTTSLFTIPEDVDAAVLERQLLQNRSCFISAANKRQIIDAMYRDYERENSPDRDCLESECRPLVRSRITKAHYV